MSVLSNLSAASHQSALDRAQGGSGDRAGAPSTFSIQGLEHSLLSRGTVTANNSSGGSEYDGEGSGAGGGAGE